MVTIHTIEATAPDSPKFDFSCYNPRIPPTEAVRTMSKQMEQLCESDKYFLRAAVSTTAIKNLKKLPPKYSAQEYAKLPLAEFDSGAKVFFLTGGTRNEASGKAFQALLQKLEKKATVQPVGSGEAKTPGCSEPLFKLANWAVQLYDFSMYIKQHHLYMLTPSPNPGLLEKLGGDLGPGCNRNSLFYHLAQNPDLTNTPQTPIEFYRQWWRRSPNQDKKTIEEFISRSTKSFIRLPKAILTSPVLLGVTRFAIQTCERLVMSSITDLDWLLKLDRHVGMEVCVAPTT
jgi:hypothetical protein